MKKVKLLRAYIKENKRSIIRQNQKDFLDAELSNESLLEIFNIV